jgi:methionyl-tRNA formyltransferase
MGSPDFSVPSLRVLNEAFEICAVYTQPPRKAGRGLKLQPTAVANCASQLGLRCFSPVRLRGNAEEEARLASFEADLFVVIAYGLILPKTVLDIPPLGCINGHASLLPRWRGAAPIQRAIEAGDAQTGVTIMQMEEGLDTGPMLSDAAININNGMNAGTLHDALAALTAELMPPVIDALMTGNIRATPQPEMGVTYATKISNSETQLGFALPASALMRKICAFSPYPGASFETKSGRLKLLSAEALSDDATDAAPGSYLGRSQADGIKIACGDNSVLQITKLQPAGKKPMSGAAFLNGQNWQLGENITAVNATEKP